MNHWKDKQAHDEWKDTPKRRKGSGQWVLLKSQILLVDVVFVITVFVVALYLIVEHWQGVLSWIQQLWTVASAAIGVG